MEGPPVEISLAAALRRSKRQRLLALTKLQPIYAVYKVNKQDGEPDTPDIDLSGKRAWESAVFSWRTSMKKHRDEANDWSLIPVHSCTICIVRGFHHGFEICVKFGWSDQWSIDRMQSAVGVTKNVLSTCLLMLLQVLNWKEHEFFCALTNHNAFDAKFHELLCTIYVISTSPSFIDSFWRFAGFFLMRLGLDFKFNYVGTSQFFWIRSCPELP